MKLIKQYQGYPQLKQYTLDCNDKEYFVKEFNLSIQSAELLVSYLQKHNKEVFIYETYDGQSGWKGFNFIIDNENISGNGFCFSEKNLLQFLTLKKFK